MKHLVLLTFIILSVMTSCDLILPDSPDQTNDPDYGGDAQEIFEVRNGNEPYFTASDYDHEPGWEYYSPLDSLGREGYAMALTSYANMNFDERPSISQYYPSGWKQERYDSSLVDGGWIYNRSHIFGRQLGGDDIRNNLMTGTRMFNADASGGMVAFENMVADHMKEYRDHEVLYRVTPDFGGDNLLAYGVLVESDCLDCDDSADFCVYIHNIQPGIVIDYSTGDSWLSSDLPPSQDEEVSLEDATYILNTNTMRFHELDCSGAPSPDSQNYKLTDMNYDEVVEAGYKPCGTCRPQASAQSAA